jgi:hypothetical protein
MVQALQANELTLSDVEDQFNLRQVFDDPTFFREWQDSLLQPDFAPPNESRARAFRLI